MPMKRGSILAETVLVMPILLLLVFGIIQFALIWTAKQMTAYAAFCATRAIMVVPNVAASEARSIGGGTEKDLAARNAAKIALSWMCRSYSPQNPAENGVLIPGWGKVSKSDALRDPEANQSWRILTQVLASGETAQYASVKVSFRYPLLIPGMAVNKIVGNAANSTQSNVAPNAGNGNPSFYDHWGNAIGNPATIDGWPYITLTETCVLPMPYSTANFPKGGFKGTKISGGGS